jgi:hypothetical protein
VAWADQRQEPGVDVLATVAVGEDDGPELGGGSHGSECDGFGEYGVIRETRPRA